MLPASTSTSTPVTKVTTRCPASSPAPVRRNRKLPPRPQHQRNSSLLNCGAMKTPPAQFYIDPARLATERERVFARSWQIVGHVGQLANPGDYFTTRLGN